MSYLIVANAGAGASDGVEDAARVLERADGCEIVWTTSSEEIDRVLATADATLVIAGGDGSIHLFVNRLAAAGQLDRPVGILAMGTGNDLARGLELPLEPEKGAARILAGRPRRLPLMRGPEGELAANNAHTGLGVVAARRGRAWKDRLGSLAYPAGSVMEGLTFEGIEARVAVDDGPVHDGPCLAVLVLVGPSAGGGFRPLPDVSVEEPVIDVLVLPHGPLRERAAMAVAALRGDMTDGDGVLTARGARAEVATEGMEWELDGEFRTWSDPVVFELEAPGWTVIS